MHNILCKMFMFLFLFFSMLLLCSFFRLKELFQVTNDLNSSLLFFCLENAKILGRSDDAKRRKKMRMAIGFFATVSKQCAGQVQI